MGYTVGGSPKGGPLFNSTPQTAADLNAGREFTEKLGNRRVDTKAARDAATGGDVWEGLEWYDITLKRTFYYDGNGWVDRTLGVFVPNVLYAASASFETPVLSKLEGRSRLAGFLTNVGSTTFTASTSYPLGTVPAGFRPAKTVLRSAAPSPISGGQAWITVDNAGAVQFALQNGGTYAGSAWGIGFEFEWENAV